MAYWVNITDKQTQPRHNLCVLDNSILASLYKLELRAHEGQLPRLGQLPPMQEQDRLVNDMRNEPLLFGPALEMCMTHNNLLVIPEAVLRECYGRKSYSRKVLPPFAEREDGSWQWTYGSMADISAQQAQLKTSWDDRGLLLSRVLQRAHDQGGLDICASREDFVEKYSHFHPDARVVIVRDGLRPFASAGDVAIRKVFEAVSERRDAFKNLSVLSADVKLRGSLLAIEQEFLSVDTGVLMDAFAKYSRSMPDATALSWSRRAMNDIFTASDFTYARKGDEPLREYQIRRAIGMQSDIFLKILGHADAVSKDSGMNSR